MNIQPILARIHGIGFHHGGGAIEIVLFLLLVAGLIAMIAFSWNNGRKNDEK